MLTTGNQCAMSNSRYWWFFLRLRKCVDAQLFGIDGPMLNYTFAYCEIVKYLHWHFNPFSTKPDFLFAKSIEDINRLYNCKNIFCTFSLLCKLNRDGWKIVHESKTFKKLLNSIGILINWNFLEDWYIWYLMEAVISYRDSPLSVLQLLKLPVLDFSILIIAYYKHISLLIDHDRKCLKTFLIFLFQQTGIGSSTYLIFYL